MIVLEKSRNIFFENIRRLSWSVSSLTYKYSFFCEDNTKGSVLSECFMLSSFYIVRYDSSSLNLSFEMIEYGLICLRMSEFLN